MHLVTFCLCMQIYFYSAPPFFICPILQNDLDDPERGMIFVCSATHKTKSMFFFLAQTEQGDIFKVTLETDEEMVSKDEGRIKINFTVKRMIKPHLFSFDLSAKCLKGLCVVSQVTEIRLKYFDTIPVATAMCVLKTGFLFVSSEFGNQ